MNDYHLPEHEIVSLKRLHKRLRVKREADKVKAVYLLGSGWAVKLTTEALDIDAQTVRQYFLDYKNQDKRIRKTSERVKLHDTGKESSLSQDQEQELSQHLDGNLYQRSQEMILYIKKKYQVEYSSSVVKKLLHRLGFSYKKPKAVPDKLDPHLQDLFIRKYRRLRKTPGENDVILFADAVHPTYQMTVDFSDSINGASTIRLLKKLERLYPLSLKIHVILDNAKYYHSNEVRDWLARHKKIKLHFLPGYSPNLNLMERCWKFFNEKVRNNRYYDTFSKLTEACKSFFRCRKKWTEELRSRLAEKFHKIKIPIF